MTGIERSSLGYRCDQLQAISDPTVYSETAGPERWRRINATPARSERDIAAISLELEPDRSLLCGRKHHGQQQSGHNRNPYSYEITHSYKDGQVSDTGRGWLGFAASTHTNASIGRTTTVAYNQAFPLIGRPQSRTVTVPLPRMVFARQMTFSPSTTSSTRRPPLRSRRKTGYKATLVRTSSIRSDKYQAGDYQHSPRPHVSIRHLWKPQPSRLSSTSSYRSGNDLNPRTTSIKMRLIRTTRRTGVSASSNAKTTRNPSLADMQSFQADQISR